MIGAGSIAANAQSTDEISSRSIKREAAAEYVDAADLFSDQRVVGLAEIGSISLIGGFRVDGIAVL